MRYLAVALLFVVLGVKYTLHTPDYDYMQHTTVMLEIRAEDGEVIGHGSGVLIDGNRVLTAGHVAQYLEAGIDIFIRFRQGEEVPAELVKIEYGSTDERLTDDIALLKIDNNYNYPTASVSCEVQPVGTDIFVVGNPMNSLWTTTEGTVISVIPRKDHEKGAWLQMDVTIWQGNSGGPIFNQYGYVVGVVSHGHSVKGGPSGFNFGVSGPSICGFLEDN